MKNFLILILAFLFISCGVQQKADPPVDQPQPQPKPDNKDDPEKEFTSEIKPLLQKNCAGGSCHTSGGSRDAVIQTSSNFAKGTSGQRLQAGSMPPAGSSQAKNFSPADKTELLSFIAKYK